MFYFKNLNFFVKFSARTPTDNKCGRSARLNKLKFEKALKFLYNIYRK